MLQDYVHEIAKDVSEVHQPYNDLEEDKQICSSTKNEVLTLKYAYYFFIFRLSNI